MIAARGARRWTWRICRPTSRRSTTCCSEPTPSACSRWRAARRWPRLPRLRRERSTTWWWRWPSSGPGPIVGDMVHPYLRRRRRARGGDGAASRARADPAAHARRAALPGAAPAHGHGHRRLHRGRGRGAAPRLRLQAVGAGHGGDRGEAPRGHGPPGHHRRPRGPIIRSITSFALYGFPESHAASFALLAYASAYLKPHHPAAFYAALLNNQPMGFYHPATIVRDAERHGQAIRPIDVNRSGWLCTIERSRRRGAPRAPLREGVAGGGGQAHRGGAPRAAVRLVADLARRSGVNREELARLAEIGALAGLAWSGARRSGRPSGPSAPPVPSSRGGRAAGPSPLGP